MLAKKKSFGLIKMRGKTTIKIGEIYFNIY
jgi:hypothetical protein